MTLEHSSHSTDHDSNALFRNFEACDLLKHNHHPHALWPARWLWFSQILQPPETFLAEFLDTGLRARAAGGGGGWSWCGLGQSGCRHVIIPLQSLHDHLEASLLLSEIMLHAG